MRPFAGLMSVLILSVSVSFAKATPPDSGHFNQVLSVIQNSDWSGTFLSLGPGPATCYGSLTVKFFPLQKEPFSGGAQTVSYRHHAQFSAMNPFFVFCQTLGKALSAVEMGDCEKTFPKKPTVEGGQKVMVPVRTIIPRNGGTSAVINTPYCDNDHKVSRLEFQVKQLEFTDARKKDAMKIQVLIDTGGLPLMVLTYDLKRVGH